MLNAARPANDLPLAAANQLRPVDAHVVRARA